MSTQTPPTLLPNCLTFATRACLPVPPQVDFCNLLLRNNSHTHSGYSEEFRRVPRLWATSLRPNTGKLINLFSVTLVGTDRMHHKFITSSAEGGWLSVHTQ